MAQHILNIFISLNGTTYINILQSMAQHILNIFISVNGTTYINILHSITQHILNIFISLNGKTYFSYNDPSSGQRQNEVLVHSMIVHNH